MFLPNAVFVLLLTAALLFHFREAWAALPVLWLPWSAHAARQQARRYGYLVDETLVAVRGGWWSRYWRFAEIDKLQALRLSRSPIDRRMGTASLWLDTAGASGFAPPLQIRFLPHVEAEALYTRLAATLARRRMRW
jgi:putative membrane protein